MKSVSREFQVFAKPVGASCNLSCSCCYYLKRKSLYQDGHNPFMSDDLLEKYVIQHISGTTDEVIFLHGMEENRW